MNLFRELGRKVEKFTSSAKKAAEEDARYRCEQCGEQFSDHHEQCPECDSTDVVAIDRVGGS